MFDDEEYVQSMIDAGAKGFLLKNITKEVLDQALQAIQSGKNYYSPELLEFFTRKVVSEPRQDDEESSSPAGKKRSCSSSATGYPTKRSPTGFSSASAP